MLLDWWKVVIVYEQYLLPLCVRCAGVELRTISLLELNFPSFFLLKTQTLGKRLIYSTLDGLDLL